MKGGIIVLVLVLLSLFYVNALPSPPVSPSIDDTLPESPDMFTPGSGQPDTNNPLRSPGSPGDELPSDSEGQGEGQDSLSNNVSKRQGINGWWPSPKKVNNSNSTNVASQYSGGNQNQGGDNQAQPDWHTHRNT